MTGPARARVRPLGRAAAWPVRFYRRFLSPLKPPTCRFHPTCSAYAIEALELHGVWRGGRLAAWRILRCQPFARSGFDPVPGSGRYAAPRACESPADVDTPAHDSPARPAGPPAPPRSPR